MFNPIKKKDTEEKPINRLSSLKHEDKAPQQEVNLATQSTKSGAAFSKALNTVRLEVGDNAQYSSANLHKPHIVSFDEAINARKEKTSNPFIKISPPFQVKAEVEQEAG